VGAWLRQIAIRQCLLYAAAAAAVQALRNGSSDAGENQAEESSR